MTAQQSSEVEGGGAATPARGAVSTDPKRDGGGGGGGGGGAAEAFARYDRDGSGFLTREDLFVGFQELELGLTPEMYRQFLDCNFTYADEDGDERLSATEFSALHGMLADVRRRFQRFDKDKDGLISKAEFTHIVRELHLNLDEALARSYVDINFRYVDRHFRGLITCGQFLACYANFLISHSLRGGGGGGAGGLGPGGALAPGGALPRRTQLGPLGGGGGDAGAGAGAGGGGFVDDTEQGNMLLEEATLFA